MQRDTRTITEQESLVSYMRMSEALSDAGLEKGITMVVFDRSGQPYEGRVKAVGQKSAKLLQDATGCRLSRRLLAAAGFSDLVQNSQYFGDPAAILAVF